MIPAETADSKSSVCEERAATVASSCLRYCCYFIYARPTVLSARRTQSSASVARLSSRSPSRLSRSCGSSFRCLILLNHWRTFVKKYRESALLALAFSIWIRRIRHQSPQSLLQNPHLKVNTPLAPVRLRCGLVISEDHAQGF